MIKAIILDDEQPSVDKLERLLNESGMVEIKGKFTEPLKAMEFLKANQVDALFVDIEMPDMDGIELANRVIDFQDKVAVVFVTAYNQYAVEAFRVNALDFLMKPVTIDRLRETLNRIVAERKIPMGPAELLVRCFGKFSAFAANREVKFRTEKAEELFAFLIDRRGSFVSRGQIMDCLWEEYEGDRALIHFNTTLHYVKKALLQYGIQAPIEHDRGSYRIEINHFDCDYCRFYEFTAESTGTSETDICEFEEVARAYKGDYLSGMEYSWVERNRQLLKDRYISLLVKISDFYAAEKRYDKVIEWMRTGLLHEPLHREINFRLIEALLQTNDHISASNYFNIYKNGLKKKLGQDVDAAFKKLMQ